MQFCVNFKKINASFSVHETISCFCFFFCINTCTVIAIQHKERQNQRKNETFDHSGSGASISRNLWGVQLIIIRTFLAKSCEFRLYCLCVAIAHLMQFFFPY